MPNWISEALDFDQDYIYLHNKTMQYNRHQNIEIMTMRVRILNIT